MIRGGGDNKQSAAGVHALAHLRGVMRSFEQNQLIFSIIFLVLFLSSIAAKSIVHTRWTDIGAGIGLLGLVTQFAFWLIRGKPTADQNRPGAISYSEDGRQVVATDIDPRDAVLLLSEIIQGQKALPPSDGAIVLEAGKGQTIRQYSEEEKASMASKMARELREHNERLIARIQEIAQSSAGTPAVTDGIQPDELAGGRPTVAERTMSKPAHRE